MTTGSTWLRGVRVAAAALLVLSVTTTGCGRPDDEAWLRCLGFKQSAETISVLEGDLKDGTSTTADIELENGSIIIGKTSGTGILVNRTRVDYRMSGFSPPAADYPVNLYLSPPAESAPTQGTLTAFPLASKSLKQWLVNAGVSASVVELTAHVTFYGVTDEGTQVETEASLGIELTNSASTPPATLPTLTVAWKRDVSRADTGATGAFTVFRSELGSDLTIFFNTTGSELAASTDFTIASPIVMPGAASSMEVRVTPKTTSTNTGTVVFTLTGSTEYKIGEPKTAQLNILL